MAKYIAPSLDTDTFTCPHCGTLSLMSKGKYTNSYDHDLANRGEFVFELQVMTCHSCHKKTIWCNNEYIYPDMVGEEPNSDMPENVLNLYKEANLIYNKSPRAACALLRLAIDLLCRYILGDEAKTDINENIGLLVNHGLSKKVQQALDIVRVVGNKAVHPGQIAFDVDDISTAKMLMRLTNLITNDLISEPNEIENMFASLPDSTKKAIERRDK